MGRKTPIRGKKGVKPPKKDYRRDKLLYQIRKICKKHPKIKKKIKFVKDLDKKLYYAKVWEVTESQPLHKRMEIVSFRSYLPDQLILQRWIIPKKGWKHQKSSIYTP
jgi:hypothetical protein